MMIYLNIKKKNPIRIQSLFLSKVVGCLSVHLDIQPTETAMW